MKYYLCGPFWDKECSEFFDKFIERCKETAMANFDTKHESSVGAVAIPAANFTNTWDEKDNVEPNVLSIDEVFVPGHFKVDFNKIKSEYDSVSFRRVLRQVLDLDLNSIDDGMIVYPKGYDLGSMFELGYFLSGNMECNKFMSYNQLKKKLIIKNPDELLIKCIDILIDSRFYLSVINNLTTNNVDEDMELGIESLDYILSNGNPDDILNNKMKFKSIAINVDCYKETPFNSMLAGYLYRLGIPFFTYSEENADSNVMMIASSMFHVKVNKDNVDNELSEAVNNVGNLFWSNSCFDRFNNIK